MEELLKTLAQYGAGGVIAGIMIYFYRQDRKDSESRLTALGSEFRQVVEKNTEAITTLTVTLRKHE